MPWNQIAGLFKFTGFFSAMKNLLDPLTNNPQKHPITYVAIVAISFGLLKFDKTDSNSFYLLEILVILGSIVLFYSWTNNIFPLIKKTYQRKSNEIEAVRNLSEITDEQKNILLRNFYPNPNTSRHFYIGSKDFPTRELIEHKILISDSDISYYDEYIQYHDVNVSIAKCVVKFIKENNLLEVWKEEKKARDIEKSKTEADAIPF